MKYPNRTNTMAFGWMVGWLVITAGSAVAADQCSLSFSSGDSPGGGGRVVLTADFNGDGIDDLVGMGQTQSDFNSFSVYLATGSGNFNSQGTVNVTGGAWWMAIGDFNTDGKPDLVICTRSTGAVQVRLGDGAGGFGPPNVAPIGGDPIYVVTSDFDGDGIADLAVADASSPGVLIVRGLGDGTFETPVHLALSGVPKALAFADFDHDGFLDLAAAADDGNVVVFGGSEGGVLSFRSSTQVFENLTGITAADFNRDGYPDVLLNTGEGLRMLLGDGVGGLEDAPLVVTTEGGPSAVANFDDDGNPDIAVAVNSTTPREIRVLRGNGDGTFTNAWTITRSSPTVALTSGDYYHHAKADLVSSEIQNGFIAYRNTMIFWPWVEEQPHDQRSHLSPVTFHVAGGGDAVSYRWFRNGLPVTSGGNISGVFTDTLTISPASFSDAGEYSVRLENTCAQVFSRTARLDVYCPADFDENGFVNGDDFDSFSFFFYWGDPQADFDGNGFVNGDDFDYFSVYFEAGC